MRLKRRPLIVGEVLFSVDQNETRLTKDQVAGTIVYYRDFLENPVRFGFNVMMQARF